MNPSSANLIARLVTILPLWLTITATAQPQTDIGLKMVASVKSQSYCVVDEGNPARGVGRIGSVRFDLGIHIENVSDHNIIVCKQCVDNNGVQFRKIQPDGLAGEYVYYPIFDSFGLVAKVPTPHRPDNNYVVLGPGDRYDKDIPSAAFITLDPKATDNSRHGMLLPGNYFFRATVITWAQLPKLTSTLKLRWKKYGELADGTLASQLIPININFPADAAMCVD